MSNSYAVVPNILPGNVTIGGNLTVGGNVIRIGAAAPFARIGKTTAGIIPVGSAFFSQNLTEDLASRDDGAQAAVLRYLRLTSMGLHGAEVNVAGVPQLSGHDESVKQLTVSVSVTGTVAETTMDSVSLVGNLLVPNGTLRIRSIFTPSVQGATATTLRIKLGAQLLFSTTRTDLSVIDVVMEVLNNAAGGNQVTKSYMRVGSAAPVFTSTPTTVDTTVAQTLAFTIQPGATTDNWALDFDKVVRFTP